MEIFMAGGIGFDRKGNALDAGAFDEVQT